MKILICCENFYPSVGGVQEVCKQLAIRFISFNHDVHIATSWHPKRKFNFYKKIKIRQFKIFGNFVRGIYGEKKKYINFILNENFDLILVYAAQQWTLDLILSKIDLINAKKILVPCGFSKLYDKNYHKYFEILSKNFNKFDNIVFHTFTYRDFEFISKFINQKNKLVYIPNGADEKEFEILEDKKKYKNYFNSKAKYLLMTNGSLSVDKGLLEVLESFYNLDSREKLELFVNCDFSQKFSFFIFFKKIIKVVINILSRKHIYRKSYYNLLQDYAQKINSSPNNNKKVRIVNYDRNNLINLYKASDIFIFASRIEYSPLVIFEALASKNVIISHDVGNVKEIIQNTKSGLIIKNIIDKEKKSIIDINDLTTKLEYLIDNQKLINEFSNNGRNFFLSDYNWNKIFQSYLKLLDS